MRTLSHRRWLKFKQNKRAYWSMWLLLMIIIISMLAPFIANSKPLILMYKHNLYFPFVQLVKDDMLGGNLPTEAVYSDSYTRTQINANGCFFPSSMRYFCNSYLLGRFQSSSSCNFKSIFIFPLFLTHQY